MRILVTGAGGYIAQACIKEFIARGWQVRAITRQSFSDEPMLEYVRIQSLEEFDWHDQLPDIDYVVHMAGIAHQKSVPADYFHTINVEVSSKLAQAAVDVGVKRLIYLSSIAVYGNPLLGIIDENSPICPVDINGMTKAAAEQRIKFIAQGRGLSWTILRVPMVYGPNAPGNFRRLQKLVRSGLPLPLASATAPRSYLGIDNLVSAMIRIIESPAAANRTFVATDGDDLTTADLVGLMADAIGRPRRLWRLPGNLARMAAMLIGRAGDANRLFGKLVASNQALRTELDWTPPVTAAAGIKLAMQVGGKLK